MKQMLNDYGIDQDTMNIMCNNSSAINISKNPVVYSWTKHIECQHYFIGDLVKNKVVFLKFVPIEYRLVDIFTKPLDSLRFEFLRKSLGIYLND